MMDVTRFTQNGTWSGWVAVDGHRIEIDPAVARGTRDRSWGVRPVGESPGGAPNTRPPQVFWLWAPLNFDDRTTYIALFDDDQGSLFYQHSLIAPVRRSDADPYIEDGTVAELMRQTEFTIDWQPGTRRARAATMTLHPFQGPDHEITFDVLYTFQMCGIGYSHPTWAHGTWRGELEVGGDEWKLADVEPLAPHNLHIQNMCKVTIDGTPGWGILEQIAIGSHPSGLTGILDPYTPPA
jgi:hypothetical protein